MSSFTLDIEGGPQLQAGLAALSDVRELEAANGVAARLLETSARNLAPSTTGALSGSIGSTVTPDGFQVGSNIRYARWFHVPFLSDGGVTYAKKVSSRGRSYGQRIPYNPFLNSAQKATEQAQFTAYVEAVDNLVERALAGVPRG